MLAQATHADLAYMHPSLGGYFAAGAAAPGAGGMVGGPLGGAAGPGGYSGTAVEVSFRLLAPVARTGNIIGKGGEHVKRVRQETGARIKVGRGVEGRWWAASGCWKPAVGLQACSQARLWPTLLLTTNCPAPGV
jgi:hypothetical protein